LRDDDVKRRKEAVCYGGLAKIHHKSIFHARRPGTARGDVKSHSDRDAVENRKKTGSGKKSKTKSEIAQPRRSRNETVGRCR
jgi:hypothetical protein